MRIEAKPIEMTACSLAANVNQSATRQVIEDLSTRLCRRRFRRVDDQFGTFWRFVGITDASELRDLTGARFGIQALAISLLAHGKRRRKVDLNEHTVLLDQAADLTADRPVGGNRSTDRNPPIFTDLVRYKTNTTDIQVSVHPRKAKLAR